MRDLLDDDLAELYPVRAADDVRLARLREGLFAEQPKRRSRSWIGMAAAAVAVMMIAGLVVFLRPADRASARRDAGRPGHLAVRGGGAAGGVPGSACQVPAHQVPDLADDGHRAAGG